MPQFAGTVGTLVIGHRGPSSSPAPRARPTTSSRPATPVDDAHAAGLAVQIGIDGLFTDHADIRVVAGGLFEATEGRRVA